MTAEQIPYLQQVRNTANTTLDVILAGMVSATSTAQAAAVQGNQTANAAFAAANAASSAASSAQSTANLGVTYAEGAWATANAAYNEANSAYSEGATGIAIAEAAYAQANAAYTQANSGVSQAQAAQSTANQGVAASGVSAGTYGDSGDIPVITVDYRGRITSSTTTAVRSFSTSLSGFVPASTGGLSTNIFLTSAGWQTLFPNQSNSANGYIEMPNGLFLQWGTATVSGTVAGSNGPYTITLGETFPNAAFICVITFKLATTGYPTISSCGPVSRSQAQFYTGPGSNTVSNPSMQYFAIGN